MPLWLPLTSAGQGLPQSGTVVTSRESCSLEHRATVSSKTQVRSHWEHEQSRDTHVSQLSHPARCLCQCDEVFLHLIHPWLDAVEPEERRGSVRLPAIMLTWTCFTNILHRVKRLCALPVSTEILFPFHLQTANNSQLKQACQTFVTMGILFSKFMLVGFVCFHLLLSFAHMHPLSECWKASELKWEEQPGHLGNPEGKHLLTH